MWVLSGSPRGREFTVAGLGSSGLFGLACVLSGAPSGRRVQLGCRGFTLTRLWVSGYIRIIVGSHRVRRVHRAKRGFSLGFARFVRVGVGSLWRE